MRRREFLVLAAATPFAGIGRGFPTVESTLLLPHQLFLPGIVWSSLAFIGQINHRFIYFDARVTAHEGKRLAAAINDEWRELPQWFSICLGIMDDPFSEHWLTGEGWERRVRVAEAFFNGGFRIEPQSGGVMLMRIEE